MTDFLRHLLLSCQPSTPEEEAQEPDALVVPKLPVQDTTSLVSDAPIDGYPRGQARHESTVTPSYPQPLASLESLGQKRLRQGWGDDYRPSRGESNHAEATEALTNAPVAPPPPLSLPKVTKADAQTALASPAASASAVALLRHWQGQQGILTALKAQGLTQRQTLPTSDIPRTPAFDPRAFDRIVEREARGFEHPFSLF